jgi:hypothetical protein
MADREGFSRVDALLVAALDVPLEERPAFLDAACADDSLLRQKLESLLTDSDRFAFVDKPAVARLDGIVVETDLTSPPLASSETRR